MVRYITSCELPQEKRVPRGQVYQDFVQAKDKAVKMLWDRGIEDDMIIELQEFDGDRRCWLALYKKMSQFPRGYPVIQVNENTQGILAAAKDKTTGINLAMLESILHEYGHIIAEWGRERDPEITRLVFQYASDEEVFAEDFMRFMLGRIRSPIMEDVLQRFFTDVF